MPVRCHPYPLNYPDLLELNCTHPGGDWAPASVEAGEWDSPALQLGEADAGAAFWPYWTRPSSQSVGTHGTRIHGVSLHHLVAQVFQTNTQEGLQTWSRWLMFDPLRSSVWDLLSVTINYVLKLHGAVHFKKGFFFWIREKDVYVSKAASRSDIAEDGVMLTTCEICTAWFLL